MAKKANPWMKFYPQDWRADEQLRLCSLAARGLWIELMALMHRSERYGQLLIGGNVPTDAQLAVQVGALPDQVTTLLAELESAGVFNRTSNGAIYSRRMTRDHKKAETARKNGKNGGNPRLRKQTGNSASDNQEDKGLDKLRSQKPDNTVTDVTGASAEKIDPVKALFDLGVSILVGGGKTEREARSLIGKWRKDVPEDELAALLVQARTATEPVAYLCKSIGKRRDADDDLLTQANRYAA